MGAARELSTTVALTVALSLLSGNACGSYDGRPHADRADLRSVGVALVVRNWLFGCYIVEYEEGGADRSQLCGKALIDRLAKTLSGRGLRDISPANLRKFRSFYESYPGIQQTASVESSPVAELTLPEDSNIYASRYQLYLPSKEELRQKLIAWIQEVGG
jgi:hypothetical protein